MACKEDIRLMLIFKDLAYWLRSSCVGLNVAAYANALVLNKHGIHTVVAPVCDNIQIVQAIDSYNDEHEHPLTHVVISAPWLTRHELRCMLEAYPGTQFIIICHSNVGFLQSDLSAMELIRFYHDLEDEFPNLLIGGNSRKFVKWLAHAYDWDDVVFLPNLYPVRDVECKEWDDESVLKIGAFGAVRPEKNFMTAAAAALAIHSKLNVPLEFHMLTGMPNNSVTKAIKDMLNGLPDVKLILHEWAYWDDFILLVEQMDLLIQPSYTESFLMVVADGIFVGVPSVVSPAVYWAPKSWEADSDDAMDVAAVGIKLLINPKLRKQGLPALKKHVRRGLKNWSKVLDIHDECWFSKFWNDMVEIFKG